MDGKSTIETLGEAYTVGWGVRMRCAAGKQMGMKRIPECEFKTSLDMMTLVATRGRDFPIARLADRLRCPRCGCRRVAVFFDVPMDFSSVRALPTRRL